jgi:hypothetical protein
MIQAKLIAGHAKVPENITNLALNVIRREEHPVYADVVKDWDIFLKK